MSDNSNVEQGQEALLLVFSNDKTEEHLNVLRGLLKMVYHTVLTNKLAIMEAKDETTGEVVPVLVGVEQNEEGISCYPLFRPITDTDAGKYSAPDGSGNYVGRTEG
jgi:hypothetical protein